MQHSPVRLAAIALAGLLAGCTGLPLITPEAAPAAATPAAATYTDPFAYCAAVGTVDAPDARYAGPEAPESIARELRVVFNTPDTPLEFFTQGMFWRCMNGRVYACVIGANIPCLSKADLSTEPTPPMAEFCQANPGAGFIPAVVTGRATVYSWRCEGTIPTAAQQELFPDEQGFIRDYWHALPVE